jgi:hypothetical protein
MIKNKNIFLLNPSPRNKIEEFKMDIIIILYFLLIKFCDARINLICAGLGGVLPLDGESKMILSA